MPSNPTRKLLRLAEAADGLRALAQEPGKTAALDLAGLAFPGLLRLQEEIKGVLPPAPPAPAGPAAPRAETYHFTSAAWSSPTSRTSLKSSARSANCRPGRPNSRTKGSKNGFGR